MIYRRPVACVKRAPIEEEGSFSRSVHPLLLLLDVDPFDARVDPGLSKRGSGLMNGGVPRC